MWMKFFHRPIAEVHQASDLGNFRNVCGFRLGYFRNVCDFRLGKFRNVCEFPSMALLLDIKKEYLDQCIKRWCGVIKNTYPQHNVLSGFIQLQKMKRHLYQSFIVLWERCHPNNCKSNILSSQINDIKLLYITHTNVLKFSHINLLKQRTISSLRLNIL